MLTIEYVFCQRTFVMKSDLGIELNTRSDGRNVVVECSRHCVISSDDFSRTQVPHACKYVTKLAHDVCG